MSKGNVRKYFAGGNTIYGFYSLFQYIPAANSRRLKIIKGGPGTGKSTLMKKLGLMAQEAGLDAEHFYCSSDPQSLDGLTIPSLGFSIIDGTAPHVVDPVNPGAYDEIVNLGACWDAGKLRPYRNEIAELCRENSEWFAQAYQYLRQAAAVMDKLRYLTGRAMDLGALEQMKKRLLAELAASLPGNGGSGYDRHLFAGAITPAGFVNHYTSIMEGMENLYYLTGDPGCGKSALLGQIHETVKSLGHDTQAYHCALDPHRLDAVVIPALKTAFIKAAHPHSFAISAAWAVKNQSAISLDSYLRAAKLKADSAELTENQERLWHILKKAAEMIRRAKDNHDRLEEYYIRAMDFSAVPPILDRLAAEMFE